MGGKGRKRREKNYEAAHGGSTRLPPPPKHSSLDALPSKLRKIMSLAKPNNAKRSTTIAVEKDGNSSITSTSEAKRKKSDQDVMAENIGFGDEFPQNGKDEKKKKKRKRNKADDLRFEKEVAGATGTQRKERKKQRLEARKKKNKKATTEADTEFLGCEKIQFGDIVEAPPKLTVPKAFKTTQGASQERLRLQAVEAYRQRKGWASRPGVQLPSPVTESSLF